MPLIKILDRRVLWLALALLASVNSWHMLVTMADREKYFVDEMWNSNAALGFVTGLNYSESLGGQRIGGGISTGIVGSLPSGLAWLLGANLFGARLVAGAAVWLLALALGTRVFFGAGFAVHNALLLSAALWSVTVMPLLGFPYWHGFLLTLGELAGALWLGWGLVVMPKRPALAALLWGLAVWHCKFIYAPLAAGFIVLNSVQVQPDLRRKLVRLALLAGAFLLPLAAWALLIFVRFGYAGLSGWALEYSGFILAGRQRLDQSGTFFQLLAARLAAPELEWSSLSTGYRVKMLVLSLGAVVAVPLAMRALVPERPQLRTDALYSGVVMAAILAYSYWYFLLHLTMWTRHFQPALYSGLGLLVYWGLWLYRVRLRPLASMAQRLQLALVVLLALQTVLVWQVPLLESGTSFARGCTDLAGDSCARH